VVGFPVDEFGWVTRQFMTVVIREKVGIFLPLFLNFIFRFEFLLSVF
jgi:hypothetical protein